MFCLSKLAPYSQLTWIHSPKRFHVPRIPVDPREPHLGPYFWKTTGPLDSHIYLGLLANYICWFTQKTHWVWFCLPYRSIKPSDVNELNYHKSHIPECQMVIAWCFPVQSQGGAPKPRQRLSTNKHNPPCTFTKCRSPSHVNRWHRRVLDDFAFLLLAVLGVGSLYMDQAEEVDQQIINYFQCVYVYTTSELWVGNWGICFYWPTDQCGKWLGDLINGDLMFFLTNMRVLTNRENKLHPPCWVIRDLGEWFGLGLAHGGNDKTRK